MHHWVCLHQRADVMSKRHAEQQVWFLLHSPGHRSDFYPTAAANTRFSSSSSSQPLPLPLPLRYNAKALLLRNIRSTGSTAPPNGL
jgi:hypothetical protein